MDKRYADGEFKARVKRFQTLECDAFTRAELRLRAIMEKAYHHEDAPCHISRKAVRDQGIGH